MILLGDRPDDLVFEGFYTRCRCVIGGVDWCPNLVPLDAPFCPDCEDRHPGSPQPVGVVPPGQTKSPPALDGQRDGAGNEKPEGQRYP